MELELVLEDSLYWSNDHSSCLGLKFASINVRYLKFPDSQTFCDEICALEGLSILFMGKFTNVVHVRQ